MHRSASQVAAELVACIRCNECLTVCPALAAPLSVATVNRQTLDGPVSPEVANFAQNCIMCGACVPVCPVGLHRDAMMLWLKMRMLRRTVPVAAPLAEAGTGEGAMVVLPSLPFAPPSHHRIVVHEEKRSATRAAAPRRQTELWRRVEPGLRPVRYSNHDGGEAW